MKDIVKEMKNIVKEMKINKYLNKKEQNKVCHRKYFEFDDFSSSSFNINFFLLLCLYIFFFNKFLDLTNLIFFSFQKPFINGSKSLLITLLIDPNSYLALSFYEYFFLGIYENLYALRFFLHLTSWKYEKLNDTF